MDDVWVTDTDGGVVVFDGNGVVVPKFTHAKTSASPEAAAFFREHAQEVREGFDVHVLLGDLAEALAVPPGGHTERYFDRLPKDHVFVRYRAAVVAFAEHLQGDPVAWDIRDPEALQARLTLTSQIVATAREMFPGMLMVHPPTRWPKLRALLPDEYRRHIQPVIQLFEVVEGEVSGVCTCTPVNGVHVSKCAMSVLPEGETASFSTMLG